MLIRRAEIDGAPGAVDVRLAGARIAEVAPGLAPAAGEPVLDARGGALLPGLHDHHIHLYALAAAFESVRCGPPDVLTPAQLARALRTAQTGRDGWIRAFGYHDAVAGALDWTGLDDLRRDTPVRLQHRSGALWMVNGRGLAELGLAGALPPDAPEGAERDERGRPTGRFFRCDAWLRERWGTPACPDISRVGSALASFGVTGVTDATATNGASELRQLADDVSSGRLRLGVRVMGGASLDRNGAAGVERGERKIVLAEHDLPAFDDLRAWIDDAHAAGRGVAVHCVTRAELALAAGALAASGVSHGDRIEHAAVVPPDLAALVAELGVCVVTQPNFVRERGDAYLAEVAAVDVPWLYRCGELLSLGVPVAGGTDAPFGEPDPWLAMQAAVDRRSAAGASIGAGEAVSPERALALFTTRPNAPGGAPRRIGPGAPADLCLLDSPWRRARETLESACVRATIAGGHVAFDRSAPAAQEPVDV